MNTGAPILLYGGLTLLVENLLSLNDGARENSMDFLNDPLMLSRIQFAVTSGFHYIYPPLSIGLGLAIVFSEAIYLRTRSDVWKQITQWWIKVFGLTFALGVATGIVQMFGFGTNWARYSRFVGDVFGSALGAEGIFAFFLEAGFLGVLMFGWNRVKPWQHFGAAILVCLGAHFSAIWIVVANSWMQTPAGFEIVQTAHGARAIVTDLWAMILNPSSVERLIHVILGCWTCGALLMTSVAAYYLLKRRHKEFSIGTMKMGLALGMVSLVLQLLSGHRAAEVVAEYQPAKLAAMEGIFTTGPGAPISLFGWVDAEKGAVIGPKVPGLLSLLATGSVDGVVKGLNDFPVEDRPPVQIVYQTYHIMIGLWGVMVVSALIGGFLWWKNKLSDPTGWRAWYMRLMVIAVVFPQIANMTGWMTAEIGRQPWTVYGLLRTRDSVTMGLASSQVLSSLGMLIVIYTLLFFCFLYLLHMKIMHGPDEKTADEAAVYHDPYSTGV